MVLPDLTESYCPQLVLLGPLYRTHLQEFFLGGLSSNGRPYYLLYWLHLCWHWWSSLCHHLCQLLGQGCLWWSLHLFQPLCLSPSPFLLSQWGRSIQDLCPFSCLCLCLCLHPSLPLLPPLGMTLVLAMLEWKATNQRSWWAFWMMCTIFFLPHACSKGF